MNKQHKVKLIDKNNKYFEVEFGYNNQNIPKFTYFSISTQHGQEEFEPIGKYQKKLLKY
jgi:hypothetical protein